MSRLKTVTLRHERVIDWSKYPFTIPSIAPLKSLELRSPICFFTGENGSGKSTLLEAIAAHYGFGREGGTRNFNFETTATVHATDVLAKSIRLSFTNRTGYGFYLRAESFFNAATYVDNLEDGIASYGGKSLHNQSHGESFLTVLNHRFRRSGFYLLDEPEAALSPQGQLGLLFLLNQLLEKNKPNIQFLIATHSPLLLAYPGAQILSFDDGHIHEIAYRESQPFQIVARFMANPERYLRAVFGDNSLVPDDCAG